MIGTPFTCAQAIYTGAPKNPSVREATVALLLAAFRPRWHFDARERGLLYFAPSIDKEDHL
jgi:hypothetical protein